VNMACATIDSIDRRLLDRIQDQFPLVVQPFMVLGEELGMEEGQILERLRDLKQRRIIRQIGPVLEPGALGYQTALVAARVEAGRLDQVAGVVSALPEVTHNYGRDHIYNLWFTLNARSFGRLEEIVNSIGALEGVSAIRLLPSRRTFKIRVHFRLESGRDDPGVREGLSPRSEAPPPGNLQAPQSGEAGEFSTFSPDALDRAIIRALQEGIELVERPFLAAAGRAGCGEDELLSRLRLMEKSGVIRRFGARLAHLRAGMKSNAMVCWRIPPERVEEVGVALAAFPQVSHCYERPPGEDFPYNIYSMVHARDEEELASILGQLAAAAKTMDFMPLHTTREYHKAAPRYFLEEDGRGGQP